jgi:prolyl-tRNA synthetase
VVLLVRDEEGAGGVAQALVDDLRKAGWRVSLDDRVDVSFGRRAVEWELKGVPVRIEVGPRDVASGNVTLVRRDQAEKQPVPATGLAARVTALLDDIQAELLAQAQKRQDTRIAEVSSAEEAGQAAVDGFARLAWDNTPETEDALNGAGVSVRCLLRGDGSPPVASDEPDLVAVVGRAY